MALSVAGTTLATSGTLWLPVAAAAGSVVGGLALGLASAGFVFAVLFKLLQVFGQGSADGLESVDDGAGTASGEDSDPNTGEDDRFVTRSDVSREVSVTDSEYGGIGFSGSVTPPTAFGVGGDSTEAALRAGGVPMAAEDDPDDESDPEEDPDPEESEPEPPRFEHETVDRWEDDVVVEASDDEATGRFLIRSPEAGLPNVTPADSATQRQDDEWIAAAREYVRKRAIAGEVAFEVATERE